jgi:hypothetical protein
MLVDWQQVRQGPVAEMRLWASAVWEVESPSETELKEGPVQGSHDLVTVATAPSVT